LFLVYLFLFFVGLEFHPAAPSREQFCCTRCKHRKGNYSKTKRETNIKQPKVYIRKAFEQWLYVGKRTAAEVEKRRQEGIGKLEELDERQMELNGGTRIGVRN
jgi:hypothetical protein